MFFITIDGDDIGQKITSCYLSNDATMLSQVNDMVQSNVFAIAEILRKAGFKIIFCAADGVAACIDGDFHCKEDLYHEICRLVPTKLTFSAGTGRTLRESYIALLFAKSSGKARLCDFGDMH